MPSIDFKVAGRVILNGEEMVQVFVGDELVWEKVDFVSIAAPRIITISIVGDGELDTMHAADLDFSAGEPAAVPRYQWTRNGVAVLSESAAFAEYTPTVEDGFLPGDLLGLGVHVENQGGFDTKQAAPVTVTGVAPSVTGTPTITGSGAIKTAHVAGATTTPGNPEAVPTFQWNKNGVAIPDAVNQTYTPTVEDGFVNGDLLTVTVNIANVAGSDSENSAAKTISGVPVEIDPTSGGDVVAESTSYWWHVFTTPGELSVGPAGAVVTSLVVSGGGAGGKGNPTGQSVNISGGGGGGGGRILTSMEPIGPGSHPVIIGAAGNYRVATGA